MCDEISLRLAAIYQFLRFQISDHQTGDRLAVSPAPAAPPTPQPNSAANRVLAVPCPPICHPERSEGPWLDCRFTQIVVIHRYRPGDRPASLATSDRGFASVEKKLDILWASALPPIFAFISTTPSLVVETIIERIAKPLVQEAHLDQVEPSPAYRPIPQTT
ncbi:MAG TPA: hypothetical protein VMI32_06400 [Candidatus Solibacter sp.]|nr:hypothetical protein [Candidatus Solibacter sp.]